MSRRRLSTLPLPVMHGAVRKYPRRLRVLVGKFYLIRIQPVDVLILMGESQESHQDEPRLFEAASCSIGATGYVGKDSMLLAKEGLKSSDGVGGWESRNNDCRCVKRLRAIQF